MTLSLAQAHHLATWRYREALTYLDLTDPDSVAVVDQLVRSIDRPLVAQFARLADGVETFSKGQSEWLVGAVQRTAESTRRRSTRPLAACSCSGSCCS